MDLPSQVSFGSCSIEVKITFSTHISLGVMSRRQAGGDEIDAMCCVGALQ